jgi:hypothetical protein
MEVYVRRFDPADHSGQGWRISTAAGQYPTWSRGSTQLFFASLENQIMAADYTVQGDSFAAATPRIWPKTPLLNTCPQS